jgi:hypothetical protein
MALGASFLLPIAQCAGRLLRVGSWLAEGLGGGESDLPAPRVSSGVYDIGRYTLLLCIRIGITRTSVVQVIYIGYMYNTVWRGRFRSERF